MSKLTRPYILYSINTNIFRQVMKKKDLPTLWSETKEFLNTYTNADINNPSFIKLKIFPLFDRKKLDANLKEIIAISERPNLDPIWNVANDNLEKVITGLHNVQQFLPIKPNAIELEIWYRFRFLDTSNFMELPNYESNAHISFIFSKRHSCSPCLIFPFENPTPEFWKYLDEVIPHLPFELNEKLLRKMYVKNGSPSSVKKITRPI
jgi:hypothetical protein